MLIESGTLELRRRNNVYAKNLIDLILTGVNLKFRIKDEQQSKELQEMFFTLGACGYGGANPYTYAASSNPFYLHCKTDKCGNYVITWSEGTEEYFNSLPSKEYDLENHCLVEECKWPNLKKLVEAMTPLKFRIKDEDQGRELQEMLFCFECGWPNPEMFVHTCSKVVQSTEDKPFLFLSDIINIYNYRAIGYMGEYGERFFNDHESKEYDLENDCLVDSPVLEPEEEPKIVASAFHIRGKSFQARADDWRSRCPVPLRYEQHVDFIARLNDWLKELPELLSLWG